MKNDELIPWNATVECYCYLRDVQDLLSDRKTPYERRFGEPHSGPKIPAGSMIEYHPTSAKDQARLHQLKGSFRESSLDMRCMRGSGKEIFWSQTLRS